LTYLGITPGLSFKICYKYQFEVISFAKSQIKIKCYKDTSNELTIHRNQYAFIASVIFTIYRQ